MEQYDPHTFLPPYRILAEGRVDVIIVWTVWKEAEIAEKKRMLAAEAAAKTEKKSIAEEIRRQRLEEQVGSR